jgi:copper chaperone CopZ
MRAGWVAFSIALLVSGAVVWILAASREDGKPSQEAAGLPGRGESPDRAAARAVVLQIEGMHCDGCVQRITEFLEKTPGVVSASVSLEEKRALVQISTDAPIEPSLIDAVRSAGYEASIGAN